MEDDGNASRAVRGRPTRATRVTSRLDRGSAHGDGGSGCTGSEPNGLIEQNKVQFGVALLRSGVHLYRGFNNPMLSGCH